MDYRKQYQIWLENDYFDEETKLELEAIRDNPKEIEERFYKDLGFGTGGLRGIIAAGTNRMNKYTVRKASYGLAAYVNKRFAGNKEKSIVIAYDSRYKSDEFALESAKVFAANGIKAYLFESLRPTPELSFAVRYLKAQAGVVVTASHNPKQYNGYKVYGDDGGQLPPDASAEVLKEIENIVDITSVKVLDEKEAKRKGLLIVIGSEVDDAYLNSIKTLCIRPGLIKEMQPKCRIVYTPLHGTGNIPVRRILKEIGFENVFVVKEQADPDPNFSTVKFPNPEDKAAFKIAIELAKEKEADLIIATDPDADRVGISVKNENGEYVTLTGNQTGCLLLEYILSSFKESGNLPENAFVVKTIVTTELARKIAGSYNIELIEVLTGFKFIGEKIKLLDEFGDKKYIFGFEESYGYLLGTFVRDKDAVVTSMILAEMLAWYKSKNMSIYEGLYEIYRKYGYTFETLDSFVLEGKDGTEKIKAAMEFLRKEKERAFNKIKISAIRDYDAGFRFVSASNEKCKLDLPKSNVLYYEVEEDAWFCIRPSGTEPKIKVYYGVSGGKERVAKDKLEKLKSDVLEVIHALIK